MLMIFFVFDFEDFLIIYLLINLNLFGMVSYSGHLFTTWVGNIPWRKKVLGFFLFKI